MQNSRKLRKQENNKTYFSNPYKDENQTELKDFENKFKFNKKKKSK